MTPVATPIFTDTEAMVCAVMLTASLAAWVWVVKAAAQLRRQT